MLLERFLDYVSYETTSSEESTSSPSTMIQLKLAEHLRDELNELKIEDVYLSETGYVYGTLKGDKGMPVIGLCSHMDTSPDASGKDVKPRIIRDYNGKDFIYQRLCA